MPSRLRTIVPALALVAGAARQPLAAQAPEAGALARRLAAQTAVTGYEAALADTVLALLPGSTKDRAGNVVLELGRGGASRTLVACPLDEPGLVVGGLRDDGYLTVRRVPGRVPPLADQAFEGQRVTLLGTRGPVPGVVGVRSTHLTRGRGVADEPFTLDQAYVDVGASSRAQAEALGVRMLTPVAPEKRPHAWGNGQLSAPVMGRRGACAALLAAARAAGAAKGMTPARTSVTVAFTTGGALGQAGVQAAAALHGPFAETLLVDGAGAAADAAALARSPLAPRLGTVTARPLAVRHAGTPVETVSLADVQALATELTGLFGGGQ